MNLNNSDVSLFFAGRQDMLTKYALVAIIVLFITVLGFTLLVHSSLCELSIKERNIELKLFSLTNRRSSIRARAIPRMGCQDASSSTHFFVY